MPIEDPNADVVTYQARTSGLVEFEVNCDRIDLGRISIYQGTTPPSADDSLFDTSERSEITSGDADDSNDGS